jgi:hypothetical protein
LGYALEEGQGRGICRQGRGDRPDVGGCHQCRDRHFHGRAPDKSQLGTAVQKASAEGSAHRQGPAGTSSGTAEQCETVLRRECAYGVVQGRTAGLAGHQCTAPRKDRIVVL